ncbi:GNAT family N-acetyltransferase [Geodermatophilus normandii]|uniref:GNAT family N-acetyltransferase n=1 Tax=Geodermatophilus normandii TaxID=1137989 RepID=A0A6P0GEB2_9ACTN|nr:GNAT family N-acetyltransferase [Geodermatophilus normandii]NEM05592.1 GNAT family N-acetyltransferase [Geodermatophilus normandii]
MTLHLRPATPDDVPAAADVLADAFTDYPWTTWAVDAGGHGERLRALHRLYLSAVAVPYGHVDLGGTGEELVGVAVWVPATGVPDEVWARVGPAAAELAGDRTTAAEEADAVLAERRLDEPHVALAGLGVARHQQGRGLGRATLVPGLARADQDRLPVHLETSAEPNVRFYARLGFTVTAVVDLPGGGPRTWLMRRVPRPAAPRPARPRPTPREPGPSQDDSRRAVLCRDHDRA